MSTQPRSSSPDPEGSRVTKVAFCFPGQGSLEVGMGREIAEAVPEAMDVYRLGSWRWMRRPRAPQLRGPAWRAVETEVQQPTLVTTSLAIPPRCAGGDPARTSSSAIPWASSPRSRPWALMSDGDAIAFVRERGLRWSRRPPATRRDGRDPRAGGSARRDLLPEDSRGLAGQLQLPWTDRRLGGERGGRGVLRRGREPSARDERSG